MNIVFCHGVMGPEMDWNNKTFNPNKNWKYWLQFWVEATHDVIMQMPAFPHAHVALMKYKEWENVMDHLEINQDTVLIGHSAGGGFVLKYLSMHPELKVRQVILVAPWTDTTNETGFYSGLDFTNIQNQSKYGVDLLMSDNDMEDINKSCEQIIREIPNVHPHTFHGYGHFFQLAEFPEITEIIKF